MTETSEPTMYPNGGPDPFDPETERWTLRLQDPEDPYSHSATARQRSITRWDVEYYRGDEMISDGSIGTPPPHMPPVATLMGTLQVLRKEADHWARKDGAVEVPRG